MALFRILLLWSGLGSVALWGQIETRMMVEDPQARVSGELVILVTATNAGSGVETWTWPEVVHAQVGQAQFPLDREASPGEQSIAPGATVLQRYSGTTPDGLQGLVSFELTDLPAGRSYAEFVSATPAEGEPVVAEAGIEGGEAPAAVTTERRARFADNLSFYEPFYFVVGPQVSWNAKFQLGFKYRMLSAEGSLAHGRPFWENLFFGYTQTSVWDLESPSAPFLDTSYKPGIFYLEHFNSVRFLGTNIESFEGGFQHESNGQGGDLSRSLNQIYIRPAFRWGAQDDWHFTFAPKVWVYVGDLSDNPDIGDYRGYVDLAFRFGHPDSFEIAATLRKGTESSYGSIQVDLTYPLDRLFFGNAASYLQFQYFNGWGETLRYYNEKGPDQYRIGFSLYR